ncbi:ferritin-like domain-containing protein [Halorhabdus rudnickae]|uniref:ferritin-like domain-containing protein n=1 Tax=Halorhabdus rudnickae TaxID=1775544 RepID=UPI001082EA4F|nr:ferritin-like domain-containing protein [Halorhabdus rudnickae]
MSQDIVDLLEQAYLDEVETAMNYLANAIYLETVLGETVAESLKEDVEEELHHAEELGYRLRFYGEVPPASADLEVNQESLQPPAEGSDVLEVVEGVIEAEEDAVETYEALIDAAEEADDPVTEDLATELLADEQAHLAEFLSYRKEFA